jgi:hypothetical protein
MIHHRQGAEATSIRQAVTHEVHAPALIWARNLGLRGLRARQVMSPLSRLLPKRVLPDRHAAELIAE